MLHLLTRSALAAVLFTALAAPSMAEAPFAFDTAPGRLPKNVVPIAYTVAIVPDAAAKTLAGTETIALDVRKPTSTIVFNTLNETLHAVKLDGVPVARVDTQNEKQLTTLTLAHPAAAGKHTLTFAYDGKLETAPQGLFVQPYRTADGKTGAMLSSQFEATDARRMFPCWDEPAFRSTFQLTATVPAAWSAVSNMPVQSRVTHGALATTTFARSPKMPTYLVEFSAGDLKRISAKADGVEHGVWAVAGQEQSGAYALANSQQILADYNAYFGVKFPLPKLDHIAVPGGFQGAMENWGAITYNDQALLYPANSTMGRRQTVFSIMAHEMAHQWNGDLVTMGWWDDIWLNESFASWMAAKETALRNPTWNRSEQNDGTKEEAMNADARTTSHAIQQHVTDELQAEASFDPAITYSKGEAFLRMLEAYLGPDTFRAGVRGYMQAHKFSNATSADLWNGLTAASGKDVAKLASGWTEQPGFPLVSVAATCDAQGNRTISLTQKRFLLSGNDAANEHWNVPLNVRSGANGTVQTVLFTADGQTAKAGRCDEPLSVNAEDIGYFRASYDPQTLATNTKNFASLPAPEKVTLLDDQWAMTQAGQAPLSAYLALASAMGNDLDARAWEQIIGALGTIEVDERGTAGHDAFLAYARGVLQPAYRELGWDAKPDELPARQSLRRAVLAALADAGDPAVIADARSRFAAYLKDRSAIKTDDLATVFDIVGTYADQATYDELKGLIASGDLAQLSRVIYALADARDPKLAAQTLELALSSTIPPQAAAYRQRLVGAVGREHPRLAWQFFQQHYKQLMAQSEFEQALSFANLPAQFWRAAPLAEIEAFAKAHTPADAGPYVARGMERARFSLALKARLVPEADAYVASHASARG